MVSLSLVMAIVVNQSISNCFLYSSSIASCSADIQQGGHRIFLIGCVLVSLMCIVSINLQTYMQSRIISKGFTQTKEEVIIDYDIISWHERLSLFRQVDHFL